MCMCVLQRWGRVARRALHPTSDTHAGFPLPGRKESVSGNNDPKNHQRGGDAVRLWAEGMAGLPGRGCRWRGYYRVELVGDIQTRVILSRGCHRTDAGEGAGLTGNSGWKAKLVVKMRAWSTTSGWVIPGVPSGPERIK